MPRSDSLPFHTRPAVLHLTLVEAAPHFATTPFACVLAMNVNLFWTDPATAGAAVRQLLSPRGRVLLGFEPPSPRGRAALRAKMLRALPDLALELHDEHVPAGPASGVFALELSPQGALAGRAPA